MMVKIVNLKNKQLVCLMTQLVVVMVTVTLKEVANVMMVILVKIVKNLSPPVISKIYHAMEKENVTEKEDVVVKNLIMVKIAKKLINMNVSLQITLVLAMVHAIPFKDVLVIKDSKENLVKLN